MQFFRTTQDDGHWHLGVADETNPARTTTSLDGKGPHRHQIQFGPDTPLTILPWTDPETGEEHTHIPNPEPVAVGDWSEKTPSGTEADRMNLTLELFQIARQNEKDSRDEAQKAKEYAHGDQWKDKDRQALENAGRPCLQLNLIAPMLKLLSGYARQNRTDWKWFPVEGSDDATGDLFDIISKHIAKRSKKEVEEIEAFDEMIETGRSFVEIIPDFTRNPKGDVKIAHFPNKNVYLTPHLKKDLSDCEALFKEKKISLSDAKTRWPDKAKKFDLLFASDPKAERGETADVTTHLVESPERYGATVSEESIADPRLYQDTVVDIALKTITLLECERREYRDAHFMLLPGGTEIVEVDSEIARKAATLEPIVQILDTQASRIRVTVSAGPYIIKDHYPIRPFNDFSLVAVYADKTEDGYYGKIHDLYDCQDEVNKRHSQIMDILNKMAAYGYLYDENTFPSNRDAERFDAESSGPGFRCKISDIGRPPLKIEGAKFPAEIFQMEMASVQMFQMISNVNVQALGQAKASESGVSKVTQIRQAMIGNEYLFDNFQHAMREVGRRAMGWAKIIYTPERVARIVLAAAGQGRPGEASPQFGGKELAQQLAPSEREMFLEQVRQLWADSEIMDYDIEIGEGALSPTMRQAEFSQWMEARSHGANVPDELLIELSNLSEGSKRRYLEIAQRNAERQMAMEERKTEAELLKSRGGAPAPGVTLQHERMVRNSPEQQPQRSQSS